MITEINCGQLGSTDYASFSPCGKYLVVVGAPDSTLSVLPTEGRSRVSIPKARNVGIAILRSVGNDVELLYSVRRSGLIERVRLHSRTKLPPLRMPAGYDLMSLVASSDGALLAAGDSYGNICVWRLQGDEPQVLYTARPFESSVYALALSKGGYLYAATSCGRQWKIDPHDATIEALHGQGSKWECYSVAACLAHGGVVMSGNSNRVWLVDMPFKLVPRDEHSAGDGLPMAQWQMDQPEVAERFALHKRVYLPAAGEDRCSYIDSDAGANIVQVYLTAARELVVVGDHGLEVWGLSPLTLLYARGHKTSPSRRIFAAARSGGRLLIACEK